MFGNPVDDVLHLEEAVSSYVARTGVKLRRQRLLTGYVRVAIETSRFRVPYYANSAGVSVSPPSADTTLLMDYACRLLRRIYRKGYSYRRVGVLLTDLSSQRQAQEYWIGPTYPETRARRLMDVVDRYNASVNRGKIRFAAEGMEQPWSMTQARRSPRFTTNWEEILTVRG
jgi:DNA polymerase V